MKTTPCQAYEQRLVDYVDGELSREEGRQIAKHLEGCPACRQTVAALERSLGLAREVWSEDLADPNAMPRYQHPRKPRRLRHYIAAAAVVLVALAVTVVLLNGRQPQTSDRLEEVQQKVARTGAAAELLAATQILASCEGTDAIVERQYRYILEEYAGTPAANSIRAQYGSRLGDLQ